MGIEINDKQLTSIIALAVSQAFGEEQRTQIVSDFVASTLRQNASQYDSRSVFARLVDQTLRTYLEQSVKEQMEALQPQIEAEVSRIFSDEVKANLVAQVSSQLARIVIRQVNIRVEDTDE